MKRIRSKTNQTYFQDIPPPDQWKQELFKMLREISRLQAMLKVMVEEKRDLRKRMYNISHELNKCRERQDEITKKYILNNEGAP